MKNHLSYFQQCKSATLQDDACRITYNILQSSALQLCRKQTKPVIIIRTPL